MKRRVENFLTQQGLTFKVTAVYNSCGGTATVKKLDGLFAKRFIPVNITELNHCPFRIYICNLKCSRNIEEPFHQPYVKKIDLAGIYFRKGWTIPVNYRV